MEKSTENYAWLRFSGVGGVDASGIKSGTTAAPSIQVTTSNANDLLVAVMASNNTTNPATVTTPSGWTQTSLVTDGNSYEVGQSLYTIASSAYTYTAQWNSIGTTAWDAGIVALEPGATSGGTLSGIPTATGTYAFTIAGTDSAGNLASQKYTLTVNPALAASAGPSESGNEGSVISLVGAASGGSGALSYSWNFGDGTAATTGTLKPSHTYAIYGKYTATLTVTDSAGHAAQSSTTVTVNDVPPTVTVGDPVGTVGTAIAFTASATDPSTQEVAAGFTYSWNFGDGSTSTLQNPSHAFAAPGTYTVTVTATDEDGRSGSGSTIVTISSAPPPAAPPPSGGPSSPSNEPLLYNNNLQWLGAFTVPYQQDGPDQYDTFSYGGTDLAYNPANNSLFMVGHPYDEAIGNISIPSTLSTSSNPADLPVASMLQPFMAPFPKLSTPTSPGVAVFGTDHSHWRPVGRQWPADRLGLRLLRRRRPRP